MATTSRTPTPTTPAPRSPARPQQRTEEAASVEEVRQALTDEAEMVMATSTPTPTPAEIDGIVDGSMTHDDKVAPEVPEMPPLAEQQAALDAAESGGESPPDPPPADPPSNVDVPLVTGTAAVGATLNCTMGNWDGTPDTYAYQWKRGATSVGTDSNSYVVVAGDAGASITCVVTATNAAGSTAAPPSTAIVIPAAR